jgi:hypothetical protein
MKQVKNDKDMIYKTLEESSSEAKKDILSLSKQIDNNNRDLNNIVTGNKSVTGLLIGSNTIKTGLNGVNLLMSGPNDLVINKFGNLKVLSQDDSSILNVNNSQKRVDVNGKIILNNMDVETSIQDIKRYVDQRIDSILLNFKSQINLSQPSLIPQLVETFTNDQSLKQLEPIIKKRTDTEQAYLMNYINKSVADVIDSIRKDIEKMKEVDSSDVMYSKMIDNYNKNVQKTLNGLQKNEIDNLQELNSKVNTHINRHNMALNNITKDITSNINFVKEENTAMWEKINRLSFD